MQIFIILIRTDRRKGSWMNQTQYTVTVIHQSFVMVKDRAEAEAKAEELCKKIRSEDITRWGACESNPRFEVFGPGELFEIGEIAD